VRTKAHAYGLWGNMWSNDAIAMQRDNWEQSLDDLITFVGHISTVQVAVCVPYGTNEHCFS
jgi:hypothetical protein